MIDNANNNNSIHKPNFGFFHKGYNTIGDIKNNCMSTATYHKCAKHCNNKNYT